MKRRNAGVWLLIVLAMLAAGVSAQEKPYDVKQDIAYGQAKGHDLLVDVFVPNGKARHEYFKPNDNGFGRGIIDVISGGWNSSRARQEEHERAAVFSILCARGYTVFAIRIGSLPHFTAEEMVANLQRGVRWVKAHAAEYNVDPERLGMMGASAGGHLSLLFMLDPQPAKEDADDALLKHSTAVKAVGAFFPPTDFLDWDGRVADIQGHGHLIFSEGVEGKSEEAIHAALAGISPARLIKGKTPPLLLIHGDADPVVPLQQSEIMVKAMRDAGNTAELIVKEGGGHFWLTLPEEIIKLADWFDQRLGE